MRLLLDTHVLIWLLHDSKRMPAAVKDKIFNADEAAVSIASLWEIAIKKSIGKLPIAENASEIASACVAMNASILPISVAALERIQQLPDIHRDPFDRLLIATAIEDDMTLVTNDAKVSQYDVQTVWD